MGGPGGVTAAQIRKKIKVSSRVDADVPRPGMKSEIIDPKSLVGLDKATIEKMLGAPQHITLAQPATVWA